MFTNQSFTENKDMIIEETVQIYRWIYQPRFALSKIHPLQDAVFDADAQLLLEFGSHNRWI